MDYYEILNIKKNASCSEIKKAYRDLARQYHPDKNLDKNSDVEEYNQKFINIHTAYTILTNEKSRKEYDSKFNETNIFDNLNIHKLFEKGNTGNGIYTALLNDFIFNNTENISNFKYENIQEKMIVYMKNNFKKLCLKYNIEARILSKLMNSFQNNTQKGNYTKGSTMVEPQDIQYTIKVSLMQIFQEKIKKIQVLRKIKCDKCNGTTNTYICNNCKTQSFSNIVCNNCFNYNFSELKCDCSNGYVMSTKLFEIKLDKTVLNNSKITFEGEGDYLHNYCKQGNITIYINYLEDSEFAVRDSIHLITEKELSLYEWLFEYNIEIYHPSQEIIPLFNSGYVNKQLIKIPNKGLVNNNTTGNLYVILKLDMSNINQDEIYNRFKPKHVIDDLLITETTECSDTISEYKN